MALGAWLLVPKSIYGSFRPSGFGASWASLILTFIGVLAVGAGVLGTMRLLSLERDYPEPVSRTRLLDVFFPLLLAVLAAGAQLDLWG